MSKEELTKREVDQLLKEYEKGRLKFTFYLKEHNTNVEYYGKQHYEPLTNVNGKIISEEDAKDVFKKIQFLDKAKEEYCKREGMRYISIPYWDFDNIEEILVRELKLTK